MLKLHFKKIKQTAQPHLIRTIFTTLQFYLMNINFFFMEANIFFIL